jgi:integrase
VQAIKIELARLTTTDPDLSRAADFRRALAAAGSEHEREAVLGLAVDAAERMQEAKAAALGEVIPERGPDDTRSYSKARQWFALATSDTYTLSELADLWLSSSDYTEQTRRQHRKSWEEVSRFLEGDRIADAVGDDEAIAYVEHLKQSGQSYNTQRRKLNSLVALWDWLGMRKHVRRGFNPWRGFRLSKRRSDVGREVKRPYSDTELLRLLDGTPEYPALADLILLALYTGARIEELCSLRRNDVERKSGAWRISVRKSKTKAGIRTIAVAHSVPAAILLRRHKAAKQPADALFPELKPGGYDGKLSWHVSKAFGRYRTARGLPAAVDFHSFRRTLITLMENLGMDQVRIARYVGHELPTIAATVYSGGSSERTALEVARGIRYPAKVERAAASLLKRTGQRGAANTKKVPA